MTPRTTDPVDLFLDELGAAPVPVGLTHRVVTHLTSEGRARAPRRLVPVLAGAMVAVATLTVVLLAGGRPDILPTVSPGPTLSSSLGEPSASLAPDPTAGPPSSPSASPAATPTPTVSPNPPTPSPRPSAEAMGTWDVQLTNLDGSPFPLRVVDFSGRLVNAVASAWQPGFPEGQGLKFIPPRDGARTIVVTWGLLSCVPRGQLEVAPDARSLELRVPPTPGCDAIGPDYAVTLEFRDDQEARLLSGAITESLVTVADVIPHSIGFADASTGWVGGTTAEGDAILLETLDGAASWRVLGFLDGIITEIATSSGRAAVGGTCPDGEGSCFAGSTFLRPAGDEDAYRGVMDSAHAIDYAGSRAVGVFPAGDESVLRVSEDGGENWTNVDSPCPDGSRLLDAARLDAAELLVLCIEGREDAPILYRTNDAGGEWTLVAGDGMPAGVTDVDFAADGPGWAWGADTPLYVSRDGARWQAVEAVDSLGQQVIDATYLGASAGLVLVADEGEGVTRLVETTDGTTWTDRMTWPAIAER